MLKFLHMTILLLIMTPAFAQSPQAAQTAQSPQDPKYCSMLKQLKPNMNIGDVFLLMGPPHSFGQPANLDLETVNSSKPVMQPQNTLPDQNDPATRTQVLQSMAQDPILGAFMSAPPDSKNVLIWTFENNSLSVSVKVEGPTVTDVKANFTCK